MSPEAIRADSGSSSAMTPVDDGAGSVPAGRSTLGQRLQRRSVAAAQARPFRLQPAIELRRVGDVHAIEKVPRVQLRDALGVSRHQGCINSATSLGSTSGSSATVAVLETTTFAPNARRAAENA